MGEYEIRPLDATTWDAFAALAEKHNGIFGGCWCTWFHTLGPDKDPDRTYESNRELKRTLVCGGKAHAALVFDGDAAIAWAEYGPPAELPNLHHLKQYLATQDAPPDFRITCIVVDRDHRRQGVAAVALGGALELIAAAGGGTVEGYPHDPTGKEDKKMSASFLYNGTRRMYEQAGFAYDRPKGLGNCVMRRTVVAAA